MFTGGPFLATYRVHSLNDSPGVGVRCVKFANFLVYPDVVGVSFVWYGEGFWGQAKYRHFGEALQRGGTAHRSITGMAADFYGNGEDIHAFTERLKFTLGGSPGPIPNRIIVSGTWEEEWLLAANNTVEEYTSSLAPVKTGGGFFDEFTVGSKWREGEGIRCKLSNYSWYGAGEWRGGTYAHMLTYAGNIETVGTPDAFGATDICQDAAFCHEYPWNSIVLKPAKYLGEGSYEVSGAWYEEWILARSMDRPAPIIEEM